LSIAFNSPYLVISFETETDPANNLITSVFGATISKSYTPATHVNIAVSVAEMKSLNSPEAAFVIFMPPFSVVSVAKIVAESGLGLMCILAVYPVRSTATLFSVLQFRV